MADLKYSNTGEGRTPQRRLPLVGAPTCKLWRDVDPRPTIARLSKRRHRGHLGERHPVSPLQFPVSPEHASDTPPTASSSGGWRMARSARAQTRAFSSLPPTCRATSDGCTASPPLTAPGSAAAGTGTAQTRAWACAPAAGRRRFRSLTRASAGATGGGRTGSSL